MEYNEVRCPVLRCVFLSSATGMIRFKPEINLNSSQCFKITRRTESASICYTQCGREIWTFSGSNNWWALMGTLTAKSVPIKQRYEPYIAKELMCALLDATEGANSFVLVWEFPLQQNEYNSENEMIRKIQGIAFLAQWCPYIFK